MSLGSWDPDVGTVATEGPPPTALLHRLINCEHGDQLAQLEQQLSEAEKQELAGLMQLEHELWQQAAMALDDAEVLSLIRFFALAENLPGWQAGAKSPVIALAKVLRQRGTRIDKPLLQWLRAVNDNRFLPYGPL